MKIDIVTEPTTTPVSLLEAKEHLRVNHNLDDRYIYDLLPAATEYVEDYTSNKYMEQTWRVYFDSFPACGEIVLPFGKVKSVTSVKYTGADNTENTLSTDDYLVDTVSSPGRVVLAYNTTWPTDTLSPSNPVEVEFMTGYTTVPYKIKQAIKLYTAHLYENREPVIVGTTGRSSIVTVPMSIERLMADYVMLRFNSVS